MKVARNIVSIVILFFTLTCYAQPVDVSEVLELSRSKLANIESYSADATFKVDIDFVNMPDKTAQIHFKAPDKFDIESDGFLMIPRIGMKPMLKQLDYDLYHTFLSGEETVNNKSCYAVKMIPRKKNSKMVLSTLWIDKETYLVMRWEVFTKNEGNISVDFLYGSYPLPDQMIFSFELSSMNIPLKYFGNEIEIDDSGLKESGAQKGKVVVSFMNFKISYSEEGMTQ